MEGEEGGVRFGADSRDTGGVEAGLYAGGAGTVEAGGGFGAAAFARARWARSVRCWAVGMVVSPLFRFAMRKALAGRGLFVGEVFLPDSTLA